MGRSEVDSYIVYPDDYDAIPYGDKESWQLIVTNGHAWGWSVRDRPGSSRAMNRKGKFIYESRGSLANKSRRYELKEALALAEKFVETHTVMGLTATAASKVVLAPRS